MTTLIARVRGLLREQRPGWMDERAARSDLYPAARLIDVAPASPPLNHQCPHGCEPGGALGEREFDGARNLTG